MLSKIDQLFKEIEGYTIGNHEELEKFRLEFLSKKGTISVLFEDFKKLSSDEKKQIGSKINRKKLINAYKSGLLLTNKIFNKYCNKTKLLIHIADN